MVALVKPVDKRLVLVVVDTTALRPVLMVARRSLHLVLAAEQDVIVNKALLLLVRHGSMTKHVTEELIRRVNSGVHLLHHVTDLGADLGTSARVQREHSKIASNADASRDNLGLSRVSQRGRDLGRVHVCDVLGGLNIEILVVCLDDWVEEVLEVIVR